VSRLRREREHGPVTIWLLPLGIAAVGIVPVVVAVRRVRSAALPAADTVQRTRTRLSPTIGALRRELRTSAHASDAHDPEIR
jgi:hypothetical protein